MNFEKIYLDGINNFLNNNYNADSITLSKFLNQNRNLIFDLLNNKSIVDKTVNIVNFLMRNNKIEFSIIYLEILSSKFSQDYELKYQLANACASIKLFKLAERHISLIPLNALKSHHYKLMINIYHKLQNFDDCIKYILTLRNIEGEDAIGTQILIDCYRRSGNIIKAKIEYENLTKFQLDKLIMDILAVQLFLAEGKFDLARNQLDKTIREFPENPELRELNSLINFKYKEFDKAINEIQVAKKNGYKDYDSAVYDCYLCNKDFKNGFGSLIKATKNNIIDNFFNTKNIKAWTGEDLTNKKLFIYPGGGIALGDQIFFFRYLCDLSNKYKNIKIYLLLTSLKTKKLFTYQNVEIIDINYLDKYLTNSEIEYFASLPTLANIYAKSNHLNSIPKFYNFLPKNEKKMIFWSDYIKKRSSKLNIGLNWKGDLKYKWDIYRSLNVKSLEEVLKIDSINFFILNINLTDNEKTYFRKFDNVIVINDELLEDEKNFTFIDTIEIIKNLNAVISTDTSIAHLAASMNIKLFLLLEHSPFWYWATLENENYYQNQNINFINQVAPGDWSSVLNELKNKILN